MARIPEAEIERLKREVSIQRLAEVRGIKLHRHGADLLGLCPFHDDRNPSLVITPGKNLWHCLGACNTGGTVIDWVMRIQGVSFRHAVELLRREHLPLAAETSGPPPKTSTVPKLPQLIDATAEDKQLLETVVDYYHQTLKQSPEAQQYLIKRGLQSSEMMEHFRLGFANRTLGYHLPRTNRAAGAAERGKLQELGLLRKSGHEHFTGSLVVPIFDSEGALVEMYGRKINDNLREGTEYHLYLPGPHRGVWNEQALAVSKDIILCEALIDALTFWVAGFRNVTASYGVNGFTEDHRRAFKKYGTERVYIAYDRDEAGEKATVTLSKELIEMGIECFRVEFPKGMDANEYALKVKPAAKSLGVLLNRAAWLGKGQRLTELLQAPLLVTEPPEEAAAQEPAAKEEKIETEVPKPSSEPELECVPVEVTEEEPAKASSKPEEPTERVFPLVAPAALPEEPAVRPMPLAMPVEPQVKIDGEEVTVTIGARTYRVLGLEKNTSLGVMRVNIRVSGVNQRGEWLYHGDTLDMDLARQRAMFIKQTAHELGVKEETIHREIGRLWTVLGDVQREQMRKALEAAPEEALMTGEEQAEALALLRDPRLMERVLADFERCGVVGEETNKKVSYLAAVSRLLDKPLAVVVQSSSAAGKSSLMEAVLDFIPEEQREEYSAMTGQALYYMGQKNLKHKILAVAEEEGASRAAYALKLLQSEGKLKIASTGKDPVSGKLITHEYIVEGPVMIFLTTTAQDVDEELLNRCLVLTVNEEQEQTRAIHRKQREAQTIEGLWARKDRARIVRLHRNAQRLLKPIAVVNNHAVDAPEFPDVMTRTRRDHMKFLVLTQAIALLHQHQREIKRSTRQGETLEYIEATEADVKMAHELIRQVLGPSLDELPPHTRRLLAAIDRMVSQECERLQIERAKYRFTRRTVRQHTRWGDTQLRVHLRRLEEMEYLAVWRGGTGQTFVYQLCVDLEGIDEADLDHKHAGLEGDRAGGARPGSGGIAGSARGEEWPVFTRMGASFYENRQKNTDTEAEREAAAHPVVVPTKPNGKARAVEVNAWRG